MPNLYPYQIDARNKVVNNRNMLLAMDCGTGKSAVALTAMERLMQNGDIQDTVLIVTLASLKYQWADEIRKFTASEWLIIDGPPAKRVALYDKIDSDLPDYVIINYDLVRTDFQEINRRKWGAIIADEISALSSFKSKRSKVMKLLAKRIPIRVGLSGTPIENGKAEALFSQFQFIDPRVLGSFWTFEGKYIKRNPKGWIVGYKNLGELATEVAPFTVRRRQTDIDVARYLPEVRYMEPRLVDWLPANRVLYRHIAHDCVSLLNEAREVYGDSWKGFDLRSIYSDSVSTTYDMQEMVLRGEIMQRITALRMVCDAPALLTESARKFEQREEGSTEGSAYAALLLNKGLLKNSPSEKFTDVVAHIEDFLEISPEHKVVVFSQYRGMLDHFHKYFEGSSVIYHGGLTAMQKEVVKETFINDAGVRVFVTSDAGGYGLNLQCANLLINYDLPWSFGKAAQRNSRIIRAGSRWPSVAVETFLMENSIELRQYEALRYKTDVSSAIFDNGKLDDKGNVTTGVTSLYDSLVSFLENS